MPISVSNRIFRNINFHIGTHILRAKRSKIIWNADAKATLHKSLLKPLSISYNKIVFKVVSSVTCTSHSKCHISLLEPLYNLPLFPEVQNCSQLSLSVDRLNFLLLNSLRTQGGLVILLVMPVIRFNCCRQIFVEMKMGFCFSEKG